MGDVVDVELVVQVWAFVGIVRLGEHGDGFAAEHALMQLHLRVGAVRQPGDKAVAMVTTAAHMVPGNHYCGWDLAYSTHGWCMVEANCTAQMGGMQIITQTGRKAELEALIAQM